MTNDPALEGLAKQITDSVAALDLRAISYVQYDQQGRIISRGSSSAEVLNSMEKLGQLILRLGYNTVITNPLLLLKSDDYVDLSSDKPVLKPRPVWTETFNPAPVLPQQEAVMKAVPKCTLSITGPVTAQRNHPGGDLKLGFTMPGTYTITMEPFPYMPVTQTFVVNPATVGNATTETVVDTNTSVKL